MSFYKSTFVFSLCKDFKEKMEQVFNVYFCTIFFLRNKFFNEMIDEIASTLNQFLLKIKTYRLMNFIKFVKDIVWEDFLTFKSSIKTQFLALLHPERLTRSLDGLSYLRRKAHDS